MKIVHFDRPLEYYDRVKDYLLENEASHNLILGITNRLFSNSDRLTNLPYLAAVEDNNKILAVALRTPPYKHKLILSRVLNYETVKAIELRYLFKFKARNTGYNSIRTGSRNIC